MKNTKKIAFSALMVALSVVAMLFAYFPYFTYAIPAFAGALFFVLNIEIGKKWAFFAYIAAAVIVFLTCEKESAMLFLGFFGYYPILKGIFEQRLISVSCWIAKLLVFNMAAVVSYLIIIFLLGIPFFEGDLPIAVFLAAMLILGNVVFVIYDIGFTRVISFYIVKLHTRIAKML